MAGGGIAVRVAPAVIRKLRLILNAVFGASSNKKKKAYKFGKAYDIYTVYIHTYIFKTIKEYDITKLNRKRA